MNPQNEWEKRLGQRLRGLSEEPPAGGWERLERDLNARKRRATLLRLLLRTAVPLTAAAALALALLLPSPDFLPRQQTTGSRRETPLSALTHHPAPAAPDASSPAKELKSPAAAGSRLLAAISRQEKRPGPAPDAPMKPAPPDPAGREKEGPAAAAAEERPQESPAPATQPHRPTPTPPPATLPARPAHKRTEKGSPRRQPQLALALQGMPGGRFGSSGYLSPPRSLLAAANGINDFYGERQGAVSNFFAANLDREVGSRVKHRVPVQAALLVSIPLSGHFSLETGLSYTFLSSEISGGSPTAYYATRQRLHYAGVPLGLRYDFLTAGRFRLYATAGAQADCCISGSQATRFLIDGLPHAPEERCDAGRGLWQASVYLRAGIQADLTRRLGFYLEPGAAYYFADGSSLLTPRSQHPFNFSWQAGVRLTLPR